MSRLLPAVILLAALGAASFARAEALESTCISCHASEEDEDLAAPVEEWQRSVHAAADVSCDACHGGDPQQDDADLSMDEDDAGFLGSPGRKEVSAFCGTCHETIARGFQESVMGQKGAEGTRVATCVTCHMIDGHAISVPDPREILTVKRCGECHEGNRALAFRHALERLGGRIERADARVAPLRGAIDTSRLDGMLRDAREHAVVVAHTYDLERIHLVTEGTTKRLSSLKAEAEQLESEVAQRRRVGVVAVLFFTVACLATLRLSSNLRRRSAIDEEE